MDHLERRRERLKSLEQRVALLKKTSQEVAALADRAEKDREAVTLLFEGLQEITRPPAAG